MPADLLLTGRHITAPEARHLGVIAKALENDAFRPDANLEMTDVPERRRQGRPARLRREAHPEFKVS